MSCMPSWCLSWDWTRRCRWTSLAGARYWRDCSEWPELDVPTGSDAAWASRNLEPTSWLPLSRLCLGVESDAVAKSTLDFLHWAHYFAHSIVILTHDIWNFALVSGTVSLTSDAFVDLDPSMSSFSHSNRFERARMLARLSGLTVHAQLRGSNLAFVNRQASGDTALEFAPTRWGQIVWTPQLSRRPRSPTTPLHPCLLLALAGILIWDLIFQMSQ